MQFVDTPTTKVSRGTNSMNYIMLHHTGDADNAREEAVVNYVANSSAQLSYHYLIGKEGTIYKLANDNQITRHAGKGSLDNIVDRMNEHAIGIAVISNGRVFTEEQRTAVKALTEHLMLLYNLPARRVIRHADYTTRKRDLGPNFFPLGISKWREQLKPKSPYSKAEITRARRALNNNSRLRHETNNDALKQQLNLTNNLIRQIYGIS